MERAEPQNGKQIETAVSFREIPPMGGRTTAMMKISPTHTPNHGESTPIQGTVKMAIRKITIRAVTEAMTAITIPMGNTANTILGSHSTKTLTGGTATAALMTNMKATTTAGMFPTTKIANIIGITLA